MMTSEKKKIETVLDDTKRKELQQKIESQFAEDLQQEAEFEKKRIERHRLVAERIKRETEADLDKTLEEFAKQRKEILQRMTDKLQKQEADSENIVKEITKTKEKALLDRKSRQVEEDMREKKRH